jgi:hypothetical protein
MRLTIPSKLLSTRRHSPLARLETWWWTGPLGHLVAGLADWAQALGGWWLMRARERLGTWWAARR